MAHITFTILNSQFGKAALPNLGRHASGAKAPIPLSHVFSSQILHPDGMIEHDFVSGSRLRPGKM
jgi:hypothetical protein